MKKYKYELIKSLIFFNLYVLELKSVKKKSFQNRLLLKSIYSSNSINSGFKILDLFEIAKQIKQIIRILQYLKKKNGLLHIINENKFFIQLLENKNIIDFAKVSNIMYKKEFLKKKNNQTAVAFDFSILKRKNYFNFFVKNIFIINNMNSNSLRSDFGTYKIYNDFNEWRKITFLLILLKRFYAKKS